MRSEILLRTVLAAAGAYLAILLGVALASCSRGSSSPSPPAGGGGAFPAPRPANEGLPKFSVAAQVGTTLTLSVSKDVTRDELRALLGGLRRAREGGRLGELIPPTTPRGKKGPHAVVQAFVMTDPVWADRDHLTRALESGSSSKFDSAFDGHTRATYVYSGVLGISELGTLGAQSGGRDYEKVFSTGI